VNEKASGEASAVGPQCQYEYPCLSRKLTLRFWARTSPRLAWCRRQFGSVHSCGAVEHHFLAQSKATEPIEFDGLCRPEVRAHVGLY
jgi:hypothetical protein